MPFILKPAGNTPNTLISQVAVFFEFMAKSAMNPVSIHVILRLNWYLPEDAVVRKKSLKAAPAIL